MCLRYVWQCCVAISKFVNSAVYWNLFSDVKNLNTSDEAKIRRHSWKEHTKIGITTMFGKTLLNRNIIAMQRRRREWVSNQFPPYNITVHLYQLKNFTRPSYHPNFYTISPPNFAVILILVRSFQLRRWIFVSLRVFKFLRSLNRAQCSAVMFNVTTIITPF